MVASVDTYLEYADAAVLTSLIARPQLVAAEPVAVLEEPPVIETKRRPAVRHARRPVRARAR
jgi:hypothetical protein